jgi:monofunctional biosynthetic peptidoglycan transglycosylase
LTPTRSGWFGRCFRLLLRAVATTIIAVIALPIILILPLLKVDPPTTSLQIQRRIGAYLNGRWNYAKEQEWRSFSSISPRLRRAVIAAEDARFFDHAGIDVEEAAKAWAEAERGGRRRGASTITMQLVKNLYLWEGWTIYDKAFRKGLEIYLTLAMELLLPKERILEIYLNVVEWGDGVYGAEAAARRHYRRDAASLSAGQAARLAAVLPSPLRRRPTDGSRFVESRAARIMTRM